MRVQARPGPRALLALRVTAVLSLAVAAVLAFRLFGRPPTLGDLVVQHGALQSWLAGDDLYRYTDAAGRSFSYPPLTALLMAPLALLPATAAAVLVLLADAAALTLILVALLAPQVGRYGGSRGYALALALPLALATEPVRTVIGAGQLDLLVFGLVVADLVALRRRSRAAARQAAAWRDSPGFRHLRRDGLAAWSSFRQGGGWAGMGIGLAAAIKLTPVLFIVYLVVTRQWRAARTAAVTALVATGLAAVVARDETLAYLRRVLWDPERLGPTDSVANQSLGGLISRLYDSADLPALLWLAFSLVVVAVGVSRAAAAHGEGDELAAFTLVGLAGAVAAPVSFPNQLLFLLPAVLVLVDGAAYRWEAYRRGVGRYGVGRPGDRYAVLGRALAGGTVYAALVTAPMWTWSGALAANVYPLLLIALVTAMPWRPGAEPGFLPRPWSAVRMPRRPARPRGAVRGS